MSVFTGFSTSQVVRRISEPSTLSLMSTCISATWMYITCLDEWIVWLAVWIAVWLSDGSLTAPKGMAPAEGVVNGANGAETSQDRIVIVYTRGPAVLVWI